MLAYELEMKGRSGLEAFYNDYLAGVAGSVRIPVDARGFKPRGATRDNISIGETPEREAQVVLAVSFTPPKRRSKAKRLPELASAESETRPAANTL